MTATQKYHLKQNIEAFKKLEDKETAISNIKKHKETRERFFNEYKDGKGIENDISYNNANILIRIFGNASNSKTI